MATLTPRDGTWATWPTDVAQLVEGGREPDGRVQYVCLGDAGNGSHPGKLLDGRCLVGYAGREVTATTFRVLKRGTPGSKKVPVWIPWQGSSGSLPGSALRAGAEFWSECTEDGGIGECHEEARILYVAAFSYKGGRHIGKAFTGAGCNGVCTNFSYGGREISTVRPVALLLLR